jgi:hypothetical protein
MVAWSICCRARQLLEPLLQGDGNQRAVAGMTQSEKEQSSFMARFKLCVLPIKWLNTTAAPVRAVAILER